MATPGQLQMYNKLEPDELFSLGPDAFDKRINKVHRIHIYPDEKVPDACLFRVFLEDHTIGNSLRMELLRNEEVIFAAYRVPHPYNHTIEIRVQTTAKSSPELAMKRAIKNLRAECSSMLEQFDRGVATLHGKPVGPSLGNTGAAGALGNMTDSDSAVDKGGRASEGLVSQESGQEDYEAWARRAELEDPVYTQTSPARRSARYGAQTSSGSDD